MGEGIGMIRHSEIKHGRVRTMFMDYESIDDVLEHLDRPNIDGGNSSRSGSESESWDLGLGYEGAIDAYTGGWAEGARKAEELAERVIPRPIGKRTTLSRGVTGMFPNVGAYLAGDPKSMYMVSKKTVRSRPFVHLYLPIGYLAQVEAETAFNRGCAMVAVVDALEMAGCRVRVTLMRNTDLHNGRLTVRFEVKDYGDRLDIDQLIFTAAHPAYYRRLIFALQERSEHHDVRHGGYGSSCDPILTVDTEPDGMAVLVVLPRLEPDHNGWSPERFLEQMVNALPEEIQSEIEPI
jgi:hypothetical protein